MNVNSKIKAKIYPDSRWQRAQMADRRSRGRRNDGSRRLASISAQHSRSRTDREFTSCRKKRGCVESSAAASSLLLEICVLDQSGSTSKRQQQQRENFTANYFRKLINTFVPLAKLGFHICPHAVYINTLIISSFLTFFISYNHSGHPFIVCTSIIFFTNKKFITFIRHLKNQSINLTKTRFCGMLEHS